jgi:hypothetical protein
LIIPVLRPAVLRPAVLHSARVAPNRVTGMSGLFGRLRYRAALAKFDEAAQYGRHFSAGDAACRVE